MVGDDVIRDLMWQSMQGLEPEPTMVLADALFETDRPDLGEDLALILAGKLPFPPDQRGEPFVTLYGRELSRERALDVVFRRLHRRFAWSAYDRDERARALRELSRIATEFANAPASEREDAIARTVEWLDEDFMIAHRTVGSGENTLRERAEWLLYGSFGHGAKIMAEEIVDAPPSRQNKLAQLFRLVLAFDDMLPPSAANRVWDRLSSGGKEQATETLRRIVLSHGGAIHTPKKRSVPRRIGR